MLVLLLAYLGLIITTLFVIDWFVIDVPGARAMLDLRSLRVCPELRQLGDPCVTMKYPRNSGWFPSFASATFWATLVSSILVLFQAGTRLISDTANDGLSKLGYMFGMMLFALVMFTAYFFQPEMPADIGLDITVHRTWAPSMLLLAHLVGIFVLYFAANQSSFDDDATEYKPLTAPLPYARATERPRSSADSIALEPERPVSAPVLVTPENVRGKLQYATLTAEITRAGIDARREDGSSVLVMWRDVVGAVVRRMPPDYDGTTFVDLVSTGGATLRLLPWTRFSGDPVEGEGEERARKLVEMVTSRCPEARLDPATRTFIASNDKAAQLPDLETLAAHDQRLA